MFVCREDATGGAGWRCERVQLLIGAEERIDALAPRTRAAAGAVVTAAEPAPRAPASPRRILVGLDPSAAVAPDLSEVAARAREHDATVMLVAVGELPETSRHAAEERDALERWLRAVSMELPDVSLEHVVELGGDPVRGVLTVADAREVGLILIPAQHGSRFGALTEAGAMEGLRRRSGVPVRAVAPDAAAAPHAGPALVQEATRIVIRGLPSDGAAGRGWAERVEAGVRAALAEVAMRGDAMAVEARWFSSGAHAVDHLWLRPLLDALAARGRGRVAARGAGARGARARGARSRLRAAARDGGARRGVTPPSATSVTGSPSGEPVVCRQRQELRQLAPERGLLEQGLRLRDAARVLGHRLAQAFRLFAADVAQQRARHGLSVVERHAVVRPQPEL